ncbi:hypothetical protein DRN86_05440 [Candidatus Geothermarchaeota archaeon]|nr:MAG: hypothetical protein DRN86_05440 [Candidatus Geothermarchaeota archaeon]
MILDVIKTEKPQKIDKKIMSKLKEAGMYRKVSFMRKELVNCPKESKQISPLNCMICEYFMRRIKGKIYCKYAK